MEIACGMVLEQLIRAQQTECGYRNSSDRMVILRCIGPEQFFLERVVFPFELLTFQCPEASEVEIWTHGLGGPELLEKIEASDLTTSSEPLSSAGSERAEAGTIVLPVNPWMRAG